MERQTEGRDKTGVWLGVTAVNPVNGAELPVFIADYVLTGYGTGAIMAVPGEDVRDFEFAEKFGLPVVRTVQPPEGFDGGAWTGAGPMINSANDEISLNGLDKATAIATITDWLVEHGHGEATTTYKLRDWLFSRQRYWGEPFPIVYDENDLPIAVPHVDAAGAAAGGRRLLAQDVRRRRRRLRPGAAAVARHGVDDGRAGPGRRAEEVPPRDQHDAQLGRVVLVLPALPGPDRRRAAWSTRSWSSTGWAPAHPATSAAWTCTSAVSSTPSCTCCTPASGTRCCTTWATSPARSRSAGWSTRATSRPSPTPTSAASTCRRPRSSRRTGSSSTRASRSTVSTGRSARA